MRWMLWIVVGLASCGGPPPLATPKNETRGGERDTPKPVTSSEVAKWIRELEDPRTAERAMSELEQLGDPIAIEPLGRLWLRDQSVRTLAMIIALARPLTADEARAKFLTAYETTGRPASWNLALQYLRKALESVDETNPRSVDSATKAADAIGEARLVDVLDTLIAVTQRPTTKKLFTAQIASIRAIGMLDREKPRAAAALAKLVDRDPPPHPRTASDKPTARLLEESYTIFLGTSAAAINALADLGADSAITPLVLALYRTPELATQLRRALVASGPLAKDELTKVLLRKHAGVERLFKDKRFDKYCGDKGDLPANQCMPVALKDFYPALVLGDFHDPASVPALLAAIERPAAPAYFFDDQPGPTQYNAVFDALRKIGAPEAAPKLRALWMEKKTPVETRILAITAYAFTTRDAAGVDELGKIAIDNTADDGLRIEAAMAYARLGTDPNQIKPFIVLAKKYLDASATKRIEADRMRGAKDAADAALENARQANDAAKLKVLAVTQDPNSTAADIKKATEAAKRAEVTFGQAKKTHREKTMPFRSLDRAAIDYRGFARMFQTHAARIEVAHRCKQDLACYTGTLKLKPADAAKLLAPYVADVGMWTDEEKLAAVEAYVDRAMLELGKRGAQARSVTDTLLDHAMTDNRAIRQAILLALPKLAPKPCPQCVTKLDAAIAAGERTASLGELNLEATILRNYFTWAR